MRPVYAPASALAGGLSEAVVLDQYLTPFNVTLTVELGGNTGGGASYTVQYSPDDPYAYNANANWYNHPTLFNLAADSSDTFYTPVRGVRLQTGTPGTGGTTSPQLVVLQAGVFG
jgi:hypothetical protein